MGLDKKITYSFKYKTPKLERLKELSSRLTPINRNDSRVNYRNLLALLNAKIDPWTLLTLSQFYGPPLRCLTFQDFQLALTLEEVEHIMGLPMKDKSMLNGLGDLPKPEVVTAALYMTK